MAYKTVPEIEVTDHKGQLAPELYSKEGIVFGNLLAKSAGTIEDHLGRAVETIDREFGEGYAQTQPALVASIVETISAEFRTVLMLRTAERCVVHGVEWLRSLDVTLHTTPSEFINLPNPSIEVVGSDT